MKKFIISGLLTCSLLFSGFGGENNKAEAASVGESVSNIAQGYVGVPYAWGGTSPSGFDCSGFIGYSFKQMGVTLPRTAADLYNTGQAVSKGNLNIGDLVFFTTYKAGASHAGIYIGNNEFVHAASSGVRVDSLSSTYWNNAYYGAKRVLASTENGWSFAGKWFYYENGVKKVGWVADGAWYFLAPTGEMQTSWVNWNGSWFFHDASGAMQTGWVYWNNAWYYMYKDGSMAKNTRIDGYYVAGDGSWKN